MRIIGRIALLDLLMAQVSVEIVGDSRFEAIQIDIDDKRVAAGLDAGKRYLEKIRQGRPVEPAGADRQSA